MQPYLLKVPLQRKEPEIHFDACQVDYICTLSDSEFRFFQHNLMEEQDFLRDYNLHHASEPAEGVRNAVMVLSTGTDDGILVCTEGYDYARYSAYVPNARQILQLKQYPTLQDYVSGMTELANRCIADPEGAWKRYCSCEIPRYRISYTEEDVQRFYVKTCSLYGKVAECNAKNDVHSCSNCENKKYCFEEPVSYSIYCYLAIRSKIFSGKPYSESKEYIFLVKDNRKRELEAINRLLPTMKR